jgi:hypothetical protein
MQGNGKLDDAIARLDAVLEQLARKVALRIEHDHANAELEEELAIMQDDRARLALELDSALGRAAVLEKAREEVLRRLDAAGAGIVAALEGVNDGGRAS